MCALQILRRELRKQGADPNDSFLLHTILKRKYKREKKRQKLLLAALTYSEADVNLRDATGRTALHCAVEVCEILDKLGQAICELLDKSSSYALCVEFVLADDSEKQLFVTCTFFGKR